MEKVKRDLRLDIVRLFALLCVVGVHYFLNSNFYATPVAGTKMYIMAIIRSFFIICVPLFIMLTGYLMNKKELSKKYYKGIIKILVIYFLCSIVFHLFSFFYLKNDVTIISFIKDVVTYQGTSYAWYVDLYIGLFLLIPFLNMILDKIKDKKQANMFLLTLFVLTGLPSIINYYYNILPNSWVNIYPLLYYYMGAYLSRYKVKLSLPVNLLLLLLIVFLDGNLSFFTFHNKLYEMALINDYSSGIVVITAFLTFNILLMIKINYTERKAKVLKTLSDAVFGAYLLSCMYDILIYKWFLDKGSIYAPVIIILVYALSLITSMIINYGYNKVKSLFSKKNNILNYS